MNSVASKYKTILPTFRAIAYLAWSYGGWLLLVGSTVLAQDGEVPSATNQTTARATTRLVGPLKIAKLLWKANPPNAAGTLSQCIATATQRDELPALREALANLRDETLAVVAVGDARDPRYVPALAASLLDAHNPPSRDTIAVALAGTASSLEQRQLLWRVWLLVDGQHALQHLAQALSHPSEAAPPSEWLQAMIVVAVQAERQPAGQIVVDHWEQLAPATQLAAIEPLTATAGSMLLLLREVATGKISKDLINTNQLRKWLASDDQELRGAIDAIWGQVRLVDNAARAELVASTWKQIQQGAHGSAGRGAVVFDRVCSQCHVLYGRGYEVGPNIVGNGRGNLQQLISNILDPSLVIGEAFQAKTVLTADGEVVSGLVAVENDRYLTLKVQGGKSIEFDKQDVEQIKTSTASLMPEGVEAQMQPQELFDLLAYLSLLKPPGAEENELIPGTPADFVEP